MALAFATERSVSRSSRLNASDAVSGGFVKYAMLVGTTLAAGAWMIGALATVHSVASIKPTDFSYDMRASLDLKPLSQQISADRVIRVSKFSRLAGGAAEKAGRLEGAHMAQLQALRPADPSVKQGLAAAIAREETEKQFAALTNKRPSTSDVKSALVSALQDSVLVAPPTETAWDAQPVGNAEDGQVEVADLQSSAELAVAEAVGPSADTGLPMEGPLPIRRPAANALAMAIAPSAETKPVDSKPASRIKPQPVVAEADDDEEEDAPKALAFARPDNPTKNISRAVPWPDQNVKIAVYDITAAKVYMPNGTVMEAHSGIGEMRDNPKFTHVKMRGPTPPGTYKLSMRETPFHGVAAIRLTPTDGVAPLGRTGLLAHTYLLRSAPGDSHGCVAFADYNKFLNAYRRGEVTHMIIVNRHDGTIPMAALRKINPRGGSGSGVAATPVADEGGNRRTLMDYLKRDG
ncbi:Protein of unknown function [Rhizobium sp. RU35A]|uniref:DUF2778 domain-containing protein n=1 Tax=Rhizobium sp. RU35A TaxID=1907414 RepID=UPI0009545FED|nr:DUF2778 domain-containing protein [Rhizobium sp. RU35A]SIQ55040.1 Protein of unknown function [Rhizobium sp. RU35A]